METLYRDLAEDIKTIKQYNQSMDSASWGYEEGILLTGNQAKAILQNTAQLQADKAELLEALEEANNAIKECDWSENEGFPKLGDIYIEIESLIQKHKQ